MAAPLLAGSHLLSGKDVGVHHSVKYGVKSQISACKSQCLSSAVCIPVYVVQLSTRIHDVGEMPMIVVAKSYREVCFHYPCMLLIHRLHVVEHPS